MRFLVMVVVEEDHLVVEIVVAEVVDLLGTEVVVDSEDVVDSVMEDAAVLEVLETEEVDLSVEEVEVLVAWPKKV